MALIKCEECEKEYSDTLEQCPHCGYKRKKEKNEEDNKFEEFMQKFLKDKKRVGPFVISIISLICSLIFLLEMNLKGIVLIYALGLGITSFANIMYSLNIVKKYNNDFFIGGIAILAISFILRIAQLGLNYAWEYFVAYIIFSIITLMMLYRFTKDKGDTKILKTLLIISIVCDIFEFFNSKNVYIKGIYWRIYHLTEAFIFINYLMILSYNKDKFKEFSDKLGNYKKQIISPKLTSIILIFIICVFGIIGIVKQQNNKNDSINENQINQYENQNNQFTSETERKKNEKANKEREEIKYIKNSFKLVGANVKKFQKYDGKYAWGLENIEVKNLGNKNIESFEVKIYFKNANGENIGENKFNLYEDIKANYSWKMEKDRYYELENLSNEIDPTKNEIVISEIRFNDNEIKIPEEKQKYIEEFFTLTSVKVDTFTKYDNSKVWGLSNIEVKNNGNKNISSFEITVFFKDTNGMDIGENKFTLREDLKVNYSWKMEKDRYYELKNLSNEIDPAKNQIKITNIEFDE